MLAGRVIIQVKQGGSQGGNDIDNSWRAAEPMKQPSSERLLELLAINRSIASTTDYEGLPRQIVERTAAFLGVQIAVLLLADGADEAAIAACVGLDEARASRFKTALDAGIGEKLCDFVGCARDRFLASPVVEGSVIRVILAVYGRHEPFLEEDATLLSALADQAAIALSHQRHVRQLEAAVAALRQTDERKDEFLSVLSHELRNPLAPIRTAIVLLDRADPYSEVASRARAVIRRQTDQLTRLIEDLLDLTRLARGKIKLSPKYIDLAEVVRRAAEDHREMLAENGLDLEMDVAPGPIWAEADPTRITQVIGNLLHNVAKFTPRGGRARVSLREMKDAQIEIRVRDNGVGIEPELRERLFEPFVQSEHSLARTRGGLGLGLALVRGILELHGGTARVESDGVGKGAEFILRLPAGAPPRRQHPASSRALDPINTRRVVVIDDNRDAAESLADLVQLFGHRAKAMFDGPGALVEVLVDPPDIVLCDLGLPGLDGYELARQIRAQLGRSVQLIALSGYAQPRDVERALQAGFDAHIAKPADPAAIDRLLRAAP